MTWAPRRAMDRASIAVNVDLPTPPLPTTTTRTPRSRLASVANSWLRVAHTFSTPRHRAGGRELVVMNIFGRDERKAQSLALRLDMATNEQCRPVRVGFDGELGAHHAIETVSQEINNVGAAEDGWLNAEHRGDSR